VRILIAEDDDRTAAYLVRGLRELGHVVDRANDGPTGLAMALEAIYDVLVIDRLLPGLNGLEIVRKVREHDQHTPVLMLSALASATDRVAGLRAGCDDYLGKPYSFAELQARLEALGRRAGRRPTAKLRARDLELDPTGRAAWRGGKRIDLQHREFLLLERLVMLAGQVVTRSMLLEAAWDYDFEPRGNIVDMHIHRLRKKIDTGFTHSLIRTVPGVGYTIDESPPD
jgi:two-component system OmpR family response regulator